VSDGGVLLYGAKTYSRDSLMGLNVRNPSPSLAIPEVCQNVDLELLIADSQQPPRRMSSMMGGFTVSPPSPDGTYGSPCSGPS